jgi:TRAP-type C4-dicarboxylate transport system permease small subunit
MSSPAVRRLNAQRLERAGAKLARLILYLGAMILFAMLLLTCVDVFGRYILNAPVNGKTEITRLMMAGLVFCALPVVSVSDEQITVDLLDRFFSARAGAIRDAIVDLLSGTCLGIMVYWLVFRSERLRDYGYVTDFLHWPLYPFAYFVSFMTLVAAVALICKFGIDVARIASGDIVAQSDAERLNSPG